MLWWEHFPAELAGRLPDEVTGVRAAQGEKPGTTHFDIEAELSEGRSASGASRRSSRLSAAALVIEATSKR